MRSVAERKQMGCRRLLSPIYSIAPDEFLSAANVVTARVTNLANSPEAVAVVHLFYTT